MLPRPDASARRLPYTTADMSERLAKRKAEQFKADALAKLANYSPLDNKSGLEKIGSAIGGAVKWLQDNAPESNPISTPVNMGGGQVSMGGQGTPKSLVTEPARLAVRRAVGDITAIPRVGEPSPSYTADQIREQGVARGVLGAAIDYSQFIPVVAKGAGLVGDVSNAYKLAMMERQANPFPTLRGASNVIDVVEGSRLPARVVEPPATPATRLAQAQTTRALPPASILKPGMVIPDSLAGIRDLPTLPSRLNFADFQSMPEYQQYLQAGQKLPTIQELEQFGFDPERAYMVHGGPGTLQNDVLDPNFSGTRDIASKNLNASLREKVVANYREADSIVNGLGNGLKTFEQTGIWNGPQILNDVTNLMNKDASRVLPINELGLNQIINVNQIPNKEFFVGKIRNMINSYQKTVNELGPTARLAQEGDYLSVYPATVGTFRGAVAPIDGATYLASSPAEQVSQYMSFNNGGGFGVPEYQMFGQHSPLASINYGNAGLNLTTEDLAAARAFFLRKVIEDRMARGLYEPTVAPTAPPTPATRLGNALAQRTLDARAAQGSVRDAGVIRLPGGVPTPELPSAQLQRETVRAELGLNIQDIEFPPKNNPLTRPQIIDGSGYGVFPNGAWKVLGLEQYNAGINSANLPNEMSALREYFGHDYDGFQETLRNPNPVPNNVFTEKIKLIDKIFEITPPTTEKFKVFRGVKTGGNYLSGDYLGAFYRSLEPGQLIIEPGYLSTSINKDIAQEWANDFADDYLLIINVPEGSVAVNPITSWEQGLKEFDEHLNAPTEEELLFNRGTILRILSNDAGVINAEIVPNYIGKEQPLSLSQPKEALLKQYSYKNLAEMIADEETQRDFYVAYFNQQPDINSLISKPNNAGMRAYDLADTIVELRYNVGFDPSDYWKFREIVDQITQTPAGKRASESLRISTSQKLISLFKKHQLLEPDTIEFLQDNLEEILQPPSYNRLLDE